MIITDKFVMLNFPKTGSTFARKVIKQIYEKKDLRLNSLIYKTGLFTPKIFELLLPKIDEGNYTGIVDQHGKYRQIPKNHIQKPVLSIVRNPFSRYVSSFFFKWWQKVLPVDIKIIHQFYPNFPELSFNEFYKFSNQFNSINHLHGIIPKVNIGINSLYFIQFFSKNPDSFISTIDDDILNNKDCIEEFKHVHFIHQESLRDELKLFLLLVGFSEKETAFIDTIEEVNKTEYPNNINSFMDMYSEELIEKVLSDEKLLFRLFPEYLP